jgi:L-ascorbate metabolism protein UlaG (beta-lactamase superfamily)
MRLHITYIGGPTALVEIVTRSGACRLLTDPTFEPAGYHYAAGPQDVAKLISPALDPSQLGELDAVLLSHDQHNDNLDPAGRRVLSRARQTLTTELAAQRLGGNARGIPTWTSVEIAGGVRVTAMPARHGPAELVDAVGPVSGWLVESEGGKLYVSGDTVLFDGLDEIARRHPVDVAMLHFGAARGIRFGPHELTLSGQAGARLARLLRAHTVIPLHYEGWTHYTERRDAIERAFAEAGLASRLRFLQPAERTPIDAGSDS